jgi:aminoglycoside phosphotransferase (APT) family kinase protein
LAAGGHLDSSPIESFRAGVIGEGIGMMAQVARLDLVYAGARGVAPASLIIKLPTPHRQNRGSAEILGLYEREIRFYADFAADLPIRVPRHYYGAIDDAPVELDSKRVDAFQRRAPGWLLRGTTRLMRWLAGFSRRRAVLLLEDLGGLRAGDQVGGASRADWHRAIETLGRLHAGYWQSERLEGPGIADVPGTARVAHALQVSALGRFRRDYAELLDAEAERMVTWVQAHGVQLHDALCRSPLTLLHLDYRLDNLFFDDAAGGAPIVIDWQLPSRGPGVMDLAYFMGGTLDPACPIEDERALVEHYHAVLVQGGVDDYDARRCWDEYRLALVLMLQRLVAAADAAEFADPRSAVLIQTWVDRLLTRLRGLDPDALMAQRFGGSAIAGLLRP